MLHRIGISISDNELKQLGALQKRFRVQSRSEAVRELIKRFGRQEKEKSLLEQCIEGYRRDPETEIAGEGPKEAGL